MDDRLRLKLKSEYLNCELEEIKGIPIFLNKKYVTGDNEKYMKMYNWMSHGYDLAETIVGKLKYGNAIARMRTEIMSKLEWKNGLSVLYVSIGTGKDLKYIPKNVDKNTLEIAGVDISIGMLKQCKKKFAKKLNLSLVNCCGEDMPFKDDSFDIVFHVGGINFFNDKATAIKEMIRVSKKGTKILISDETADFIEKQFKKSQLSKKYFKDMVFDFGEIKTSIPEEVKETQVDLLWDGKCYCITFRK